MENGRHTVVYHSEGREAPKNHRFDQIEIRRDR